MQYEPPIIIEIGDLVIGSLNGSTGGACNRFGSGTSGGTCSNNGSGTAGGDCNGSGY